MTGQHRSLTVGDRNPVVIRAAVTALATAIVHLLVVRGAVDHATELAVAPIIDGLGLVVLVVWARTGVTPNSKVIARVTTDGRAVTGDAAVRDTGAVLEVTGSESVPVLQPVRVRGGLVDRIDPAG